MDPDEAILEVEEAMLKCVEYLNHEFIGVRTGKASPALIENLDVNVQAYGGISKLKCSVANCWGVFCKASQPCLISLS